MTFCDAEHEAVRFVMHTLPYLVVLVSLHNAHVELCTPAGALRNTPRRIKLPLVAASVYMHAALAAHLRTLAWHLSTECEHVHVADVRLGILVVFTFLFHSLTK